MVDVVAIFVKYVGTDKLPALLDDLATCDTAQHNKLFAELVRRCKRAAQIGDAPVTRGGLLDLMEADNSGSVTTKKS